MGTNEDGLPETYAGKAPRVAVATSERAGDAAMANLPARQRLVIALLGARGPVGYTVREFRDSEKLHHGTASSLFTTLHQRGRLAALLESREGAGVYVLPEHVNGRETRSYGRIRAVPRSEARRAVSAALSLHGRNPQGDCPCGASFTTEHLTDAICDALATTGITRE